MRKSSTNSSLDVSVVCVFTLGLVFLELDTHCAVSESVFFLYSPGNRGPFAYSSWFFCNTHFVMHLSERGTVEVQLVVDHFVYSFLHFVHIVDGHCSKFRVSVRFRNQRTVSFFHLWLSFGSVNHQLLHRLAVNFQNIVGVLIPPTNST